MAEDGDTSFNCKTPPLDECNSDKSFVKKVKSRVSGFLSSSLTRWFGTTEGQVRYRDESDDDDEESFQTQPPTKKIKSNDTTDSVNFQLNSASTPIHTFDVPSSKLHPNNINHVENKLTFPEPVPGPSGYKPRKPSGKSTLNKQLYTVQNDVPNGDKYSDSGESVTSGYSSMLIGSKDVVNGNKTETVNNSLNEDPKFMYTSSRLNDRSLFAERCTSPQQQNNTSLSTRQPSFNSSVFGSPNFVDRTIASKKILSSPFYSGRTTYGGASAYGRSLASLSTDCKTSMRNSIQIKPVNDTTRITVKNNTTLSKTARRILDTLEQYTTPISDAKKIPNPTNPNRKKYSSAKPYSIREKTASNRELQVPTVPDLLKMKLKERLQDSTETVRQLANSSKSVLNKEEYKIRTLDQEESTKHTNKMKNKISSGRQKCEPHRTVEEVKLPDIQLPITTLPKFDFSLPALEPVKSTPSTCRAIETVKTSINTSNTVEKSGGDTQKKAETNKIEIIMVETFKKDNNKKESNKKTERANKMTEFVFSDPLVIAENLKSLQAINNFIFSEPTPANKIKENEQTAPKVIQTEIIDLTKTTNPISKNNGEKSKKDLTAALDSYKRDFTDPMAKFRPSGDTWECSVCLIRNVNSKNRCAACESPRPQESGAQINVKATGFGDKFKITADQWECKICMVVNPSDKNKCAACESPKDDKSDKPVGMLSAEMWECQTCLVRNKNSDSKCVACTTPKPVANGPLKPVLKSGFGIKFAPPPNTWPCDICAVRNKNDVTNCIACQSPRSVTSKPPSSGGFGHTFKKAEGQWECGTCMVRNTNDKERCQCCDALKPGAFNNKDLPKDKTPLSLFNFGIDPNSTLTSKGFSFGIKPSENKTETSAASSIFGQNTTAISSTSATTSASTVPGFSFGIKPAAQEKGEESKVPKAAIGGGNGHKETGEGEKGGETSRKSPGNPVDVAKSAFTSMESRKEDSTLNGETKPSAVLFGIPAGTSDPTSSSTPNIFAKNTNPTPVFGISANPIAATDPTASSSIFGANPSQNATTTFKPSKPVAFASPAPQTQAAPSFAAPPSLFNMKPTSVFGASSQTAAAVPAFRGGDADVFSFGQANKPPTEQPKFGFGALPIAPAGPSGGFTFGQAVAQPSFSAGAAAASAGGTAEPMGFKGGSANHQNGAPPPYNFGVGASVTPKTGYNFGGQATQSQAISAGGAGPSGSGTYNFGFSGSSAAPNPGAFNFTGNTTNTEFRPNFNFTTGAPPPAVSGQPNSGDKSSRVIRKAVRRSHR